MMMMRRSFFLAVALLSAPLMPSHAASTPKDKAHISADSLSHQRDKKIVTADGNVEIHYGGRTLLADHLQYQQKEDIISAQGQISLLEPDGGVLFADDVTLQKQMETGVMHRFGARLSDGSLLAASRAYKQDDHITNLDKTVYSPCQLCEKMQPNMPLWQIKARKVKMNDKAETLVYHHAFFEVYGLPVFYVPYFMHPTPNAKRKSGLLVPKYSQSSTFGTMVTLPYYINIAPQMDLKLSPTLTGKEGGILEGTFRHLTPKGQYQIKASITNPEKRDIEGNLTHGHQLRSHVEADGAFRFNESTEIGFDIHRASDDTYLSKYNINHADFLTSRLYSHTRKQRQYLNVEALSFQELQVDDDPGLTPLILPVADAHIETKPHYYGGKLMLDANLLALYRDEGVSSTRLSLQGQWHKQFKTHSGQVIKSTLGLRGDGYSVEDVLQPDGTIYDGQTGRLVPEANVEWSWPWYSRVHKGQLIIEPVVQAIVSPYGGNPDEVPNEDGQDVEFGISNLFSSHHVNGLDRVESGPRLNYGLRSYIQHPKWGQVNMAVGQNARFKPDNQFSDDSGIGDYRSDIVGRVGYQWNEHVDLSYRFRVEEEDFALNNNALALMTRWKAVKAKLDYISLKETFSDDDARAREEILFSSTLDITSQWQLATNVRRDLEQGQWRSTRGGIWYRGDCIEFVIGYDREFTSDRDIKPESKLSLQFYLKNLSSAKK